MKIKPNHIQRFEAFIQNTKDPNEKDTKEIKKNKQSEPAPEEEETQDTYEDENDPLAEMKRYYKKREKNYPHLWKSTI